MADKKNKYENIFNIFKEIDKNIIVISNESENEAIKTIKYKGKICTARIIEKKPNIQYIKELKGPHIIKKLIKLIETKYKDKNYYLMITENHLKHLGDIIKMHEEQYIFGLIHYPFSEIFGNNLIKYFTKDIVKGLETLDRNEFVHNDLKSENILMVPGMKLKIAQFKSLINLKNIKKEYEFPKEAKGYVTPEFFVNKTVNKEIVKKQDYFSLGATLSLLKVGHQMLSYFNKNDPLSEDRVIDLLQREIIFVKTNSLFNLDCAKFICDLLQYAPEERPSFEEIYRSKWLNQNYNELLPITNGFLKEEEEEDKIMKELIKSDFILKKQQFLDENHKNRKNFTFCE